MTTLHDQGPIASIDFHQAAHHYAQRQRHQSSGLTLTARVTRLAAFGLVAASTTYGAVFAFTQAQHFNIFLAAGALVFAVSLEIAKPQAFAAIFDAARSGSQRAALGLLAVVACAYSLTAELQLTAMSRSDTVASRQQKIDTSADVAKNRTRLETELADLPTVQPASIVSDIAKLIRESPNARCDLKPGDDEYGRDSKKVCPTLAALRSQQAAAEDATSRRTEITQALSPSAKSNTEGPPAVDKADPGASALSAYLAVLGVSVKPDVLAEWMVLTPVLALELGSLLAWVLVAPTNRPAPNPANSHGVQSASERSLPPKIEVAAYSGGEQPKARETLAANTFAEHRPNILYAGLPFEVVPAKSANIAAARLVEYVREHGGVVQISTRRMADALACKHSTLTDAVEALEVTGILSASPGKRGTTYRLSAPLPHEDYSELGSRMAATTVPRKATSTSGKKLEFRQQ